MQSPSQIQNKTNDEVLKQKEIVKHTAFPLKTDPHFLHLSILDGCPRAPRPQCCPSSLRLRDCSLSTSSTPTVTASHSFKTLWVVFHFLSKWEMIYASWNLSHFGTKRLILYCLFFKKLRVKTAGIPDTVGSENSKWGVLSAVWLHSTRYSAAPTVRNDCLSHCQRGCRKLLQVRVLPGLSGMMPNALLLDINSSTQSPQSAQTSLVKGALLAIPLAALVSYNFLQYYFYHNIYIDFHASRKHLQYIS